MNSAREGEEPCGDQVQPSDIDQTCISQQSLSPPQKQKKSQMISQRNFLALY